MNNLKNIIQIFGDDITSIIVMFLPLNDYNYLIGKWKNRRAIVKGVKTNDKGQPVLLTDKGEVKLFHFRLAKTMPKKKKV
jgi:hypothetical protein